MRPAGRAPHLKAAGGLIRQRVVHLRRHRALHHVVLAYGTAKAGLIYLTRGLAVALGPEIRVNAVAPAFTDTQWMRDHYGADYENIIDRASANYPLKRVAKPEEVAGAVLGLITGGDFVTGQTLLVDGGLSLS